MLKIARQIVCVNMGIAWRAVPTSGATISPVAAVASAPSHLLRRWQSSPGADATQQVQESMDKVKICFIRTLVYRLLTKVNLRRHHRRRLED